MVLQPQHDHRLRPRASAGAAAGLEDLRPGSDRPGRRRRQAAVDPGLDRQQRGFAAEAGGRAAGRRALAMSPFRDGPIPVRHEPGGAISSRCVCFQRLRNLVAVDPLTGELLWVRHDIPQGSEVFGDDQYIFVLEPPQPVNVNGPFRGPVRVMGGGTLVVNGRVIREVVPPRPWSSGPATARRWANEPCRRSTTRACRRATA